MVKKKDDKEKPKVSKTCQCWLDGNTIKRMDLGEITLEMPEPGPKAENFADEAFKRFSGSLRKLMAPYYRVVVVEQEREFAFGLDRWIKLMDGSADEAERAGYRKQRVRYGKKAA